MTFDNVRGESQDEVGEQPWLGVLGGDVVGDVMGERHRDQAQERHEG